MFVSGRRLAVLLIGAAAVVAALLTTFRIPGRRRSRAVGTVAPLQPLAAMGTAPAAATPASDPAERSARSGPAIVTRPAVEVVSGRRPWRDLGIAHLPASVATSRRTSRTRRLAAALGILLLAVPLTSVLGGSGGHGPKTNSAASQGPKGNPEKSTGPRPKPTPTPTAAPTRTPTPTPTPSATTSSPSPTGTTVPSSGYSVATWGNDANAGTLASPWRTLQKAANAVPAGGTVYLRSGTYAGFTMSRSGTATAEITLTEYPGETATISGSGGPMKVIALNGVHDVTIANLTVENAPAQYGAGIYIENGAYDVTLVNNILQNNRSFGVKVVGSTKVTIQDNTIRKNETGIEISGAGEGVLIHANRIHSNDRMIVNDATAWNDRGANAISFYRTTGTVTATSNTIYGNRAVSHDYGFDGGAFEVYASSNLIIRSNTLWDNENVLETGTDGTSCSNNRFTRNVAYRGTTTSVAGPSMGMILRCAKDMLVANNTFIGLDKFALDVSLAGGFAGSIDGLKIHNNVAVGSEHPYSLDTAIPSTVSINYNLVHNPMGGAIAYVYGKGNTNLLSQFSTWTGFDRNGLQADPQFVAPATNDYHLKTTSPGIDRGIDLGSVTSGYLGPAPDVGRYEIK